MAADCRLPTDKKNRIYQSIQINLIYKSIQINLLLIEIPQQTISIMAMNRVNRRYSRIQKMRISMIDSKLKNSNAIWNIRI